MKKIISAFMSALLSCFLFPTPVTAALPYECYNYDFYKEGVPSPAAYVPAKSMGAEDFGTSPFLLPTDIYVNEDGRLFVCDTGNNRIVVLDNDLKFEREIESFVNNGVKDGFRNPGGIYFSEDGLLYVADTENNRVVIIDRNDKLVTSITYQPADNKRFYPLKVTADAAGRVYVVARGIYEGILCFDKDGSFFGFYGMIKVAPNALDLFWKSLATKEQKARMQLFIPTEFTNLDIDDADFIFASTVDPNLTSNSIKRLNPGGTDVMNTKRNPITGAIDYPIIGDFQYYYGSSRIKQFSGRTRFIDVVVRQDGIFSALDSTRGRIFTYDSEGNILYIFGVIGDQEGTFRKPSAIEVLDDQILVLDEERGRIEFFRPTEYGANIEKAVSLRYNGDEAQAVYYWKQVLKMDANYELAYTGIGKSLLTQKKNKEAMEYFKLGMDKRYYSIAFKRYRNEILKEVFVYVISAAAFIGGGSWILVLKKKWRKRRRNEKSGSFI